MPRRTGLLLTLLSAGLVVVTVRATVATPVRVSSSSMQPTLAPGDVVLVDTGMPPLQSLDRGDLVTLVSPDTGTRALKRVVGLPGDTLLIRDSVLVVNEQPQVEPHIDHAGIDGYYSPTVTVPSGHVFVLGDHRGNSIDSRDYGPVAGQALTGRVLVRLWPPLRLGGPQPSPPKP